MSQHDLDLANQSGSSFRADANNALKALASTSKGASRPTNTQTGQLWIEDDAPSASIWTLWLYDGANDICLGYIDTTNDTFCSPAKPTQALSVTTGTMDLGAKYSDLLTSASTTTVTSLGTAPAGTIKEVWHTAAQQYTYNATSLITPGAASYTTTSGDVLRWLSLGSGNWRCIGKYNVAATVGTITGVTASTGLSGGGTSGTVSLSVVNPIRAWASFAGSTGTIGASNNVSSVTRNSTGNYTVAFTTALADANYAVSFSFVSTATNVPYVPRLTARSSTGFTFRTDTVTGTGNTDQLAIDFTTVMFQVVR